RRGIWHTRVKLEGKGREISLETRNYNEARKNRPKKIEEVKQRLLLPDLANLHFVKAADLWLAERSKLVRPNTYPHDKESMKRLREKFSGKKVSQITSADLRAYQLLRIEKVGSRTVNLELKVLRQLLQTARCWSRLADDYKPLKENHRGPGRALTTEEETN